MTIPFVYPPTTHVRRHGPCGYTDYESYRPWLRDEFTFRCVYYLLREQWGRVRGTFDIDHFLPVGQYPEQQADYDNLLYTCTACNAAKGGMEIPDPCVVLLRDDVRVLEDGTIEADARAARRLIRILGLNAPESVEFRMLWIGIITLAELHDPELYRRWLRFPDDLPDLRGLRPPEGNSRPEGIEASYLLQRERGELPECF